MKHEYGKELELFSDELDSMLSNRVMNLEMSSEVADALHLEIVRLFQRKPQISKKIADFSTDQGNSH